MIGSAADHSITSTLPRMVEADIGTTTLHRLQRLKGGYSRQLWAVDLLDVSGRIHEFVLCMDTPEGVVKEGEQTLDRASEGRLLRALHASGLPVPDALAWGDADCVLGRPFVLMERIAGSTAVGPLARDPHFVERHELLAHQMADMLASIHAAHVPAIFLDSPVSPPADEMERWRRAATATPNAQLPIFGAVFDWLDRNRPTSSGNPVLVHGDFRTGNLIYDHTGFVSVLDWEMAHLGDALEDVAWAQLICWQLGTGRVGGLVNRNSWAKQYERASGRRIDNGSLRFWEVLGSLKMSILAWRAIQVTADGKERSLLEQIRADLARELATQVAS